MSQRKYVDLATTLLQIVCVILTIKPSTPRIVDRCEVARTIRDHTTIKEAWNIKQLVCIADQNAGRNQTDTHLVFQLEQVSKFNTSAEVNRQNSQRSVGIYQIPSRFYCRDKLPHEGQAGLCHKLCRSYLDENIVDDVFCASIAFKRAGFRFWKVWYHQCYLNKDINSYIEGCDIE